MRLPNASVKWFSNQSYAQEWEVIMNAYRINETFRLNNGTLAFKNNTQYRAILSSTIKYLLLPVNIYPSIIEYLLYDKFNQSIQVLDSSDGLFYYFTPCNLTAYQSLWLRFETHWFEVQPRTYLLERHPIQRNLCRLGIAASQSQEVVLGLPFLRNFYFMFDTENDQLGITTHNVTRSR